MSVCLSCVYWDGSWKNGDIWCKYYKMWHDPRKTDCTRFEEK